MKQYLRAFEKKKRFNFKFKLPPLSFKQKVALGVLFTALIYSFAQAQGIISIAKFAFKTLPDIIGGSGGNSADASAQIQVETTKAFMDAFSWFDLIRAGLGYIVEAQQDSISTVASTPFAGAGMLKHITSGLTIFACIGCAYKIVTHFLKTERHDNINSIFGYFSYLAPLALFIFSNQIVNYVAGINKGVNVRSVTSIGASLNSELENIIKADYANFNAKIAIKEAESLEAGIVDKVPIKIDIFKDTISTYVGNSIKYLYFSFFVLILTSVLAIPSFILTFMVKVLLSVMIAGAKLVFLLAFIPGFENAWKTFMLNIINVLLWIPIFNAIISFILGIISATMVANSLSSGQIVWLTIVAIVSAYQSISLTTSAANSIINGAGAGMAGAMGSLATMSGVAVGAGVVKAGAGVATTVASGGVTSAMTASKIASKLSKD